MAESAGLAKIVWDRCHAANALSLVLRQLELRSCVPWTCNHVLHHGVTMDSKENSGISLRSDYWPHFHVYQQMPCRASACCNSCATDSMAGWLSW